MRILILSSNLFSSIGSIVKIALGRTYFKWLMLGQILQLIGRTALLSYGGGMVNIWCKKNEISNRVIVPCAEKVSSSITFVA